MKTSPVSKPVSLLTQIHPSSGYVLIEPEEPSQKTSSGIYLPESHDEKPQQGKVIAIGSDEITDAGTKKTSPAPINSTVIYKKWGGNEVKIDNKEYLLVKFDDILAVIS